MFPYLKEAKENGKNMDIDIGNIFAHFRQFVVPYNEPLPNHFL